MTQCFQCGKVMPGKFDPTEIVICNECKKLFSAGTRICADCEYCNWDKRDKPCCNCVDHSEFVAYEE